MDGLDGLSESDREEGLHAAQHALDTFSEYFAREPDAWARTAKVAFRVNQQAISFAEKLRYSRPYPPPVLLKGEPRP